MANYTLELRQIVSNGVNIFNFDYEFYDEAKKKDFEDKFVKHFYLREIGVETLGEFLHHLENKFNEDLPYYNMLFRTAKLDYDIKNNYNISEEYTKLNDAILKENLNGTNQENLSSTQVVDLTAKNEQTGTNNSEKSDKTTSEIEGKQIEGSHIENTSSQKDEGSEKGNITQKDVASDTPSSLVRMTDIEDGVYASNVTFNKNVNNIEKLASKENIASEDKDTTITNLGTSETTVNSSETDKTSVNTTDTSNQNTKNNASNNVITNLSKENNTTNNETFKRATKGNNGKYTEMELITAHIELQKTLSKIMKEFFKECEDLFMQIY